MTRRNLLALFGAGATIVPLIGGIPETDALAKLIEPAKVEGVTFEPIRSFKALEALDRAKFRISVAIRTARGEHFRFEADSFALEHIIEYIPIRELSFSPQSFQNGRREVRWSLKGVTTEEPEVNLPSMQFSL